MGHLSLERSMSAARTLTDEDVEAIAERVAAKLSGQSDWMTQEAACELLGYTPQHMRRLGVPRHKRGRRVRYKRSELEAWMAADGQRKSA
jgi:exonuclease I